MAKLNKAAAKRAFNKAVDVHKANGGNPTQVRPKIKSINKNYVGVPRLTYANGIWFDLDEVGIASIVHSYTSLVAVVTGNFDLIYIDPILE